MKEKTFDKIYLQHGFKPIKVRIIAEKRFTYTVIDSFGNKFEALKSYIFNSIDDALDELNSFKSVIENYMTELEKINHGEDI